MGCCGYYAPELADLGTISATITNGYNISERRVQFWLNITATVQGMAATGDASSIGHDASALSLSVSNATSWHDAGCDDYEQLQYLNGECNSG